MLRLQVHDLDALLAPAAEHHNGFVPTGRGYDIKRHAAEFNRIARGIEADAGGERRRKNTSLRGRCPAEQSRKSESTETE
jgi:hypothetical protein